jgi:hypothetical protein
MKGGSEYDVKDRCFLVCCGKGGRQRDVEGVTGDEMML